MLLYYDPREGFLVKLLFFQFLTIYPKETIFGKTKVSTARFVLFRISSCVVFFDGKKLHFISLALKINTAGRAISRTYQIERKGNTRGNTRSAVCPSVSLELRTNREFELKSLCAIFSLTAQKLVVLYFTLPLPPLYGSDVHG